jgi:hypothetical protein
LPSNITGDCLNNFPVLHPWEIQPLPLAELELGDGKKEVKISWIWKSYGSMADTAESTNDGDFRFHLIRESRLMKLFIALRLLWLRSRAWANRWKEEIDLVTAEMVRVETYLLWEKDKWTEAAVQRQTEFGSMSSDNNLVALNEGLAAYAYRQADLRECMHGHFRYLWRYIDDWRADPNTIPTMRSWYADHIQPDKSMYLYK